MKRLFIILLLFSINSFSTASEIKNYTVYGGTQDEERVIKDEGYFISVQFSYNKLLKKYIVKRAVCNDQATCYPLNLTINYDDLFHASEQASFNSVFDPHTVVFNSENMIDLEQFKKRERLLRSTPQGSVVPVTMQDSVAGLMAICAAGLLFVPGGQIISAALVGGAAVIEAGEYEKAYHQDLKKNRNNTLADISAVMFANPHNFRKEVILLNMRVDEMFFRVQSQY